MTVETVWRTEVLNHEEHGLMREMQLLAMPENRWEEMLREEFAHHRKSVARINNGSFGSCPASVLAAQVAWQKLWLEQPDDFYFGPLEEGLIASRSAIAKLIRAQNVQEIVLVDNVTTAAAIIAQDIAWGFTEHRFQQGDAILQLSCSYGAVKKCFEAYAVRAGASIIQVKISFPISSNQQIIDSFKQSLQQAAEKSIQIRLAVIDHITSMPSVILPVKQLVQICRAAGVEQIFVDGAHAAGNVDLSVEAIDADYYSSNLHKWMFAPHSVAFLHTKIKHLERLHHPVVSHNYKQGLFSECAWIGTRDYSAQLAVTAAIEFVERNFGGVSVLAGLNHRKVVEAGEMLVESWGTGFGSAPEMASSMIMVELPKQLVVLCEEDAIGLRTKLRREFDVEIPVCWVKGDDDDDRGRAYVRISHQVYNKFEDYVRLRDAVVCMSVKNEL